MIRRRVANWLPNRPATWTDVLLVGAGGLLVATTLYTGDGAAWRWVALGGVVTLVALGPIASTSAGARFGTWFHDIGVVGRGLLVVGYAILLGVLFATVVTPGVAAEGLFVGVLVGTVTYGVAHIVSAGEVRGWRPERDT